MNSDFISIHKFLCRLLGSSSSNLVKILTIYIYIIALVRSRFHPQSAHQVQINLR